MSLATIIIGVAAMAVNVWTARRSRRSNREFDERIRRLS